MRHRAGVILIEDGQIAMIERTDGPHRWLTFPGGGVRHDEDPADAAVREAAEELGLTVVLGPQVAEVRYPRSVHRYWRAQRVSGRFGTGDDVSPGMIPRWMAVAALPDAPVRPAVLADALARWTVAGWPASVVVLDATAQGGRG